MNRQYMNILFTPALALRESTEGLCGFMDSDDTNDFQGPDGVTYTDAIEFAESCKSIMDRFYRKNKSIFGSLIYFVFNFT